MAQSTRLRINLVRFRLLSLLLTLLHWGIAGLVLLLILNTL